MNLQARILSISPSSLSLSQGRSLPQGLYPSVSQGLSLMVSLSLSLGMHFFFYLPSFLANVPARLCSQGYLTHFRPAFLLTQTLIRYRGTTGFTTGVEGLDYHTMTSRYDMAYTQVTVISRTASIISFLFETPLNPQLIGSSLIQTSSN